MCRSSLVLPLSEKAWRRSYWVSKAQVSSVLSPLIIGITNGAPHSLRHHGTLLNPQGFPLLTSCHWSCTAVLGWWARGSCEATDPASCSPPFLLIQGPDADVVMCSTAALPDLQDTWTTVHNRASVTACLGILSETWREGGLFQQDDFHKLLSEPQIATLCRMQRLWMSHGCSAVPLRRMQCIP